MGNIMNSSASLLSKTEFNDREWIDVVPLDWAFIKIELSKTDDSNQIRNAFKIWLETNTLGKYNIKLLNELPTNEIDNDNNSRFYQVYFSKRMLYIYFELENDALYTKLTGIDAIKGFL